MTEEQMELIKYEGLKAVCKKYIEVIRRNNPDADWKDYLTWRLEYEDMELSEGLIGVSVGIWRGAYGDQSWDSFEWFSLTEGSQW